MEYSKEDLMEAKKQILGVGENMGTEESKKIWEENAQFWDKGVFEAQGQLQIIFGTGTVNKVYEEFIALSGVEAATKAEVKEAAA